VNKVIIVFCEGQQDIAFLSKILFCDGFQAYDKTLDDFIEPLNKQYKTQLSKIEIGDRKLGFNSDYMIPSVALNKSEDILVLFHNLNGDSRTKERGNILDYV